MSVGQVTLQYIKQQCKLCGKDYEITAANVRLRRNQKRQVEGMCSIECRNSFRFMTDPSPTFDKADVVTHGTSRAYGLGCRCWECFSSNTEKCKKYLKSRKEKMNSAGHALDGVFTCATCQTQFREILSVAASRIKQSKSGNLYCSKHCCAQYRSRLKRESK